MRLAPRSVPLAPPLHACVPPRLYALPTPMAAYPEAAGPQLSRIVEMGFDWLLLGPVEDSTGREADAMATLIGAARQVGLKVMLRVGSNQLQAPAAWCERGVQGFLLTAAKNAPVEAEPVKSWLAALPKGKRRKEDCLIIANLLGRPPDDLLSLASAGISWFLNSFAWWDLRESWFLDQQRLLAPFAHTIATPEPWPGPRLIHNYRHLAPAEIARAYLSRYLMAASVSSGILCPMGFEIGASAPLDDQSVPSDDWESLCGNAPFDLSAEIKAVNQLKATTPALAGDGRLIRASSPDAAVIALAKSSVPDAAGNGQAALTLINASSVEAPLPSHADLAASASVSGRFVRQFPANGALSAAPLMLPPHAGLILLAESTPVPISLRPTYASERRLRELAANRVVIEAVSPSIEGGLFPVKRVLGQTLAIEADIFIDGDDRVDAAIRYRHVSEETWREAPLTPIGNDRWRGTVPLDRIGRYFYFLEAWHDAYATWCAGLGKKLAKEPAAQQSIRAELEIGLQLIVRYGDSAPPETKPALKQFLAEVAGLKDARALVARLTSEEARALMASAKHRENLSRHPIDFQVYVDRPLAANAAWYELMPRSQSGRPDRHGTFADVINRLPYIRSLGFDVLSFPPIHPIGTTDRKGRNNSPNSKPGDPGSPFAVGSAEGGHEAIHPELGRFEDFERLVKAARSFDLEIALDFAAQCSPDHPWVKQHPEWFGWQPDGAVQHGETPPERYDDILRPHFYGQSLPALWLQFRDVVLFWVARGVKILSVDNPETKPLPFWDWLIRDVQNVHPDVIFLAKAFATPKMTKRLTKIGFTQSLSYFTWRNDKAALTDYFTELTHDECRDYMRPNVFPNMLDINPVYLQENGRVGFQIRLVLAALLSPLYGLYNGYEICEAGSLPGKERYLNSEKYEIRAWDMDQPGNIKEDIRLVNRIRRDNPALWRFTNLTFLNTWNDQILAWYKISEAKDNLVIVAVNLDAKHVQEARFEVPLWAFGLPDDAAIEAIDLVHGNRLTWNGKVQSLRLDPASRPYAIWRLIPPGSGL